jgi:hypothetical protein
MKALFFRFSIAFVSTVFMVFSQLKAQELVSDFWSVDGEVKDIIIEGCDMYVAGGFGNIGKAANGIALLSEDSIQYADPRMPDFNEAPSCAVPDGNGGWYVGGEFTRVGGINISYIVRLTADLQVDEGFGCDDIIENADNVIKTLELDDDYIYIGGKFTVENGSRCVCRLDRLTGRIDNSWNPDVTPYYDSGDIGIKTISLTDSTLIIGGSFVEVNNTPHINVAILSKETGEMLPSISCNATVNATLIDSVNLFLGTKSMASWGNASSNNVYLQNISQPTNVSSINNDSINAIIPDGNAGWYIYGWFTQWSGYASPYLVHVDQNLNPYTNFVATDLNLHKKEEQLFLKNGYIYFHEGSYANSKLVRVNATTGERDASWEVNLNYKTVHDLYVNDTAVFIVGDFIELDTISKEYLAAISVADATVYNWGPQVNNTITNIEADDNYLYIYGSFTQLDTIQKNNFARLHLNGKVDTLFTIERASAYVSSFDMILKDSLLYVAGAVSFKDTNDIVAGDLFSINVDNQTITGFAPNEKTYTNYSATAIVNINLYGDTIFYAHQNLGSIADSNSKWFIAPFNRFTGEAQDWLLEPDSYIEFFAVSENALFIHGSNIRLLNAIHNVSLLTHNLKTSENNMIATMSGGINDIEIVNNSVLIGGDFTEVMSAYVNDSLQNPGALSRFIEIDKESFNVLTTTDYGIGGRINKMSLLDDKLLLTGFITQFNTGSEIIPRNGFIAIDTATFTFIDYAPNINNKTCEAFVQDSSILLLGNFNLINSTPSQSFAAIDICSNETYPLIEIPPYGGVINVMASSGDTLFLAGSFSTINENALTPDYLAAVNKNTGEVYTDFSPLPDVEIKKMVLSDGKLFVYNKYLSEISGVTVNQLAIIDSKTGELIDCPINSAFSTFVSVEVSDFVVQDNALLISGKFLRGIGGDNYYGEIASYDLTTKTIDTLYDIQENISTIDKLLVKDSLLFYTDTYNNGIYALNLNTDTIIDWNPDFKSSAADMVEFNDVLYYISKTRVYDEYGEITNFFEIAGSPFVDDTTVFSYPMLLNETGNGWTNTLAFDGEYMAFGGPFMNLTDANLRGLGLLKIDGIDFNPEVIHYSPKLKGNKGDMSVRIQGKAFANGTQFYLQSGETTYNPESIENIKARELYGTLSAADLPVGMYDLVVVVPDDTTIVIQNAIEIELFTEYDLWAQLIGPEMIVYNRPTTFSLVYGNNSNVDAVGVPIYIVTPKGTTDIRSKEEMYYVGTYDIDYDSLPDMFSVEDDFMGMQGDFDVFYAIIPFMPSQTTGVSKLTITNKMITESAQTRVFILDPILENEQLKVLSSEFFDCLGEALDIVTDVVPIVSDIKGGYQDIGELYGDYKKGGVSGLLVSGTKKLAEAAIDAVPVVGTAKNVYEVLDKVHSAATEGGCKSYAEGFWPPDYQINFNSFSSWDPNDKYGPKGEAGCPYVNRENPFVYMITYENADTAQIAAQRVIVVDTLNTHMFNIESFKFIDVGFADTVINISEIYYDNKVQVDLRPARNMIVEVQFDLDTADAIAKWVFRTLDPTTMQLTDDVFGGFLNPNVTAPEGEGFVTYQIDVNDNLSDGDSIENDAVIIFDWNEPIWTPEWKNILDETPPVSYVEPLPDSVDTEFRVSWTGSDAESGISLYDVYVSQGTNSEYYKWISGTSQIDSIFVGEYGQTYNFYCIAVDSAFNYEEMKLVYEATTRVKQDVIVEPIPNTISNNATSNMLYVSPNPGEDEIVIHTHLPSTTEYSLDLLSSKGDKVAHIDSGIQSGDFTVKYDVSNLKAGVYYLVLTYEGSSCVYRLMVK